MILLDSAMKYGQRSSLLSEKFGSYHGKGSADLIIGRAHYLKGENEKAISVLEEAHEVFDSLSVIKRVRDVSKVLFKVYEEEGEHQKALKWHKTFLAAKDSVMDQEKEKKLALLEAKHRFREKRKLREARHQKELAIAEQEKRIQRIVSYASGAGLFMVLLFAYFLFDRLRTTRRQKRTIEEQKGAIEQKQEEIMASIDYASHIQAALLKDVDERREELPEHFVMFRPKDVVSGDFYWSSVEGDLTWFAVADCTGHGVPGAFLTMLGTTFLNEIIPHQKDPTPASVLDELDARFISELGEKADDGMDISILCIDRSKRTFQWAGANNPLYLVRKGGPEQIGIDPPSNVRSLEEAGNTLFELKPDKAPIGQSRKEEGFSLCQGTLGGNEHFYLFSDGYPDQFGGDKGKKFKYRPLKELILSLSEQPMNEQCKELEEQFDRWKGDLEQVDDVCLAGLRIP